MEISFQQQRPPAGTPVPQLLKAVSLEQPAVPTDSFKPAPVRRKKSSKKPKAPPTQQEQQQEPPVKNHGPSGNVKFSYNPQDQLVMEPETFSIAQLNPDVSTDKLVLNHALQPSKDGYVFDKGSSDFTQANTFAAADRTVEIFSKAYGPIHWAFGDDKLKVNADVGDKLNANYQRSDHSVNFYHGQDTVTGQVVYSGNSGEVVSHEVGHAILDSLRPNYHNSWSLEPKAFHESFGDVTAFLTSLQDPAVVDRVVAQTGGNLSKPNILSASAEELGKAINDNAGWNRTGGDWIRNLNNTLKWADPNTLPHPEKGEHHDPSEVTYEAYNFSRIWSGAFYDVFKSIVNDNLKAGQSPKDALNNASAEGIKMYARLMKEAPEGDFTFKDMANAFIKSDEDGNGGKHAGVLRQVFAERNILTPGLVQGQPLPMGARDLSVKLDDPALGKFAGATVSTKLSGDKSHGLVGDAGSAAKLRDQMARLVKFGEIKYTEPGQVVTANDLIKPDGRPYTGVVTYKDGQMTIERVDLFD